MKKSIKLLNKIWSQELQVPKKSRVRTTQFYDLKKFRKLHPELSMEQCIKRLKLNDKKINGYEIGSSLLYPEGRDEE